jgi:ABC-type phosphate/phosphonate transport system substrate-binding protein
MKRDTILLGAVASSPEVVTIWDGFKAWLNEKGLPFDYVLYTNYERQVNDLLAGRIDVAWNTPLAWVRAERTAKRAGKKLQPLVMRDIDFDLTSLIAVRVDGPIRRVSDLKGRVVAVGSPDSVEATLMPLSTLRDAGLVPGRDFELRACEDSIGYHGGHQQGEVLAAQALVNGEVDAAGLATGNYEQFCQNGIIPAGATRILTHTAKYDHCNMTIPVGLAQNKLIQRMRDLFLEMPYSDPRLRPCMDLEYVKQWRPARVTHYRTLEHAIDIADLPGVSAKASRKVSRRQPVKAHPANAARPRARRAATVRARAAKGPRRRAAKAR